MFEFSRPKVGCSFFYQECFFYRSFVPFYYLSGSDGTNILQILTTVVTTYTVHRYNVLHKCFCTSVHIVLQYTLIWYKKPPQEKLGFAMSSRVCIPGYNVVQYYRGSASMHTRYFGRATCEICTKNTIVPGVDSINACMQVPGYRVPR